MTSEEEPSSDTQPGILDRLLKRRVVQSAAIYIAVAWGAVEIFLTLQEQFGWPAWMSRALLALFIAGFPLVVAFAWFQDIGSKLARGLLVFAAAAIAAVALLLTLQSGKQAPMPTATVSEAIATVAVLPFVNDTGSGEDNFLAQIFTQELTGRLSKHPDLSVIQEDSINLPRQFSKALLNARTFLSFIRNSLIALTSSKAK